MNVAAKTDHVAEADLREKGEQLLIAEAAIRKDGDAAVRRHKFGQPPRARIREIVALVLQLPVFAGAGSARRVLGHQPLCQGERLPDHCHRQRRGQHDAERGTRQRVDPLGMQVSAKHLAHERPDIRKLSGRRSGFAITPLQPINGWHIY
jgi:hypothetical protein